MKLWRGSTERRAFDALADLYSTIKVLDLLEAAFTRDAIEPDEYTSTCRHLLAQYKTLKAALERDGKLSDLQTFVTEYRVSAPRALQRIEAGEPATVLYGAKNESGAGEMVQVSRVTESMIGLIDALELEQRSVDELYPHFSGILSNIGHLSSVPESLEGRDRMRGWLAKLSQMRAGDSVAEEDAQQMRFDIDLLYTAFQRCLGGK